MVPIFEGALLGLLLAATVTDLSRGKVYNVLTFPALLLGIAAQCYFSGFEGLKISLLSVGTAFCVFFPLWMARVFAAGDAKLFLAAAAWLTPTQVLGLGAGAIVVGALVGLPFAVAMRRKPSNTAQSLGRTKMPFAPAVLVAFFVLRVAEMHQWL